VREQEEVIVTIGSIDVRIEAPAVAATSPPPTAAPANANADAVSPGRLARHYLRP
jgi:hypothetical protein